MAVGDVFEVIDVQSLQGQQVLNVYFYQQQAAFVPLAGSLSQNLAEEFVETIVPEIADRQTDNTLHEEVRVRNLFDPTDTGVAIAGIAGGNASVDTGPSFNAIGFQLSTDNALVRDGAKRLAGAPETENLEGVWDADYLISLNTLADILAAPITGGLIVTSDIMFPVVVKRVRSGVPGAYEYRLPENSGELVFGNILEALVKIFVTSQVSRKIGVGL